MKAYLDLLRHVRQHGEIRGDRTGTGTIGIFGAQLRFDLAEGFPLVTTKKVHLKSITHELLWFLSGSTQNAWLTERGVSIWNEWATAEQCAKFGRGEGDLGPVYGHQWRNWNNEEIDQIKDLIKELKTNPNSRRMLVSAWNPSVLPDTTVSFAENVANGKAALPPCHAFFQFYVAPAAEAGGKGKLSCQLYQRSADIFLGVPFNIASYSLLVLMVAQVCGLQPGDFVHTMGDAHLYSNHLEQAQLQLTREPYALPTLKINPDVKDIFSFKFEDFTLENYQAHPHIKAAVAV